MSRDEDPALDELGTDELGTEEYGTDELVEETVGATEDES